MALLGDDGRGYELARKLESQGVWRSWLGDALYANFVHFLSSPASWDSFMSADDSKSRAQINLQLRARALLFDKACVLPFAGSQSSSSSSAAISRLNPNYLQLHGDDVYFTFEGCMQDGLQQRDGGGANKSAALKPPTKAATGAPRYGEKEMDTNPQRFRQEEFPENWYVQFFETYGGAYRLSLEDREMDKRTPEQMSTYLRIIEKHKRRRVAFKEDETNPLVQPYPENGLTRNPNSVSKDNDDEACLFPETMFPFNCVPDSALPPKPKVEENLKVDFNGVLDSLPQIMTRSPIMIERLGIRPEYLSMGRGGIHRGKNGSEENRRLPSQQQASDVSKKVIARVLTNAGFEASSEVPMEILSQLLSCHIHKLGSTLKIIADSYRRECSAIELLKMFLQTTGHSNLGPFMELVKDSARNSVQQTQQQIQVIRSQMQQQPQQPPLRPSQQNLQIPRQMIPLQQMVQSHNLTFHHQQQQLVERMRRRQPPTPRPGMNANMDNMRPLLEVKLETPADFPIDNNPYGAINARHPQLQHIRQHPLAAAMSNFRPQASNNQLRQLASLQIPQSPSMGTVRAQPVKVEGFQELMGGDSAMKHDSEDNKLTSP